MVTLRIAGRGEWRVGFERPGRRVGRGLADAGVRACRGRRHRVEGGAMASENSSGPYGPGSGRRADRAYDDEGRPDRDEPSRPTRLSRGEWVAALRRTVREFGDDRLTDWAAALTYY